jgi:hypothetical protein
VHQERERHAAVVELRALLAERDGLHGESGFERGCDHRGRHERQDAGAPHALGVPHADDRIAVAIDAFDEQGQPPTGRKRRVLERFGVLVAAGETDHRRAERGEERIVVVQVGPAGDAQPMSEAQRAAAQLGRAERKQCVEAEGERRHERVLHVMRVAPRAPFLTLAGACDALQPARGGATITQWLRARLIPT